MTGYALDYLHRAFQAFAAWVRCDDDPHPLVKRAESRRVYARFQAEVKRRITDRQAHHRPTSDIVTHQQRKIISALTSYVQQRKHTHV